MISFLVAVTSKVAIDSILAGSGLAINVYKTAKGIRQNNRGNQRRRRK